MNKARAKNILHWVGFVAVVVAAVYIAVIAKGLGVVERVTLAATTLGGLFVALAKVFPVLDKTVDETLPDDTTKLPPPSPGAPVICLLALGSLLLAGQARADFNLDDIAPRVTKCWGNTCLMPAASVNAVLFDINAKKWQAGTTSLGAGLALLFAADSPWASGITAHLTGVLAQQGPSFAMPTLGLVLARYFEAGYSRRFGEGPDTSYVSVAGNIPWDLFASHTIPERAKAARLAAEKGGL